MTVPSVAEPIFEIRDVIFCYQEVAALDGLNLTILAGQRVALLGANWIPGKSTLSGASSTGSIFPQHGSVNFCGQPLTEERALQTQEIRI